MGRPLAVLIVEDVESDAQLIVRMLTKAGYTLTFERVDTAAQIRRALEKQPWEIVISDFSMPGLDGFAALKVFQEAGLDIPFIAVSGTMGEETAVAMMKAGAHDYVMKGNLARLAPAIERELKQAETRREARLVEHQKQKRVKELRTLFSLSMIIEKEGITLDEVYQELANILPAGWQYPEIAYARIVVRGSEFCTKNFKESAWIQSTPIKLDGTDIGKIEVGYLEKRLDEVEGPFLLEERALIDAIAERIGRLIETKQAEEALSQQHNELLKLNRFSIDLTMLSSNDSIEELIARQIKDISNAEVALFSRYDPANRTINAQHIEVKPGLSKKVVNLLGTQLRNIHTIVSEKMYRVISKETIAERKTLYEASFGAVSRPVGEALQKLLNVDRFIGIAYLIDGKLFGTSLLGMSKDQPDPPRMVLENYILLAGWSLRRRLAEEMLKENETRLSMIFKNDPTGLFIVHEKTRIINDVNDSALETIGLRKGDVVGKVCHRFMCPAEMGSCPICDFGQVVDRSERVLLKPDGARVPILKSVVPITIKGENYLLESFIDITERKKAEEELRVKDWAIKSALNAIAISDLAGNLIHVNPAFLKLWGCSSQAEVLGKPVTSFWQMGDKAAEVVEALQSQGGWVGELIAKGKDGAIFDVEVAASMVKDVTGQPVCMMASFSDITKRKRAEEKIMQLNAELEKRVEERTRDLTNAQEKLVRQERLAVLGQISGSVSHELRNPLGVISNAIYFLNLVQPEADEKIKKYHAMIEHEVQTADKIIADLLDFARLKSLEREPLAVAELVQSTLKRFPVPESIKVKLKLPADLPLVFADPRQMEQVLGNLVTNACQAMSQDSTTSVAKGGKLTISVKLHKQMVAIAVKDNGEGILAENMKNLFEPLFTTKIKGIGLGLAVSKKLAEANGGRIEVQSERGKGSTFMLWLPIQDYIL